MALTDGMFDNMVVDNASHKVVLEKIELHLRHALHDEGLHTLADMLRTQWQTHDPISMGAVIQIRTAMLGLLDNKVYLSWPRDWRQHTKQALYKWLRVKQYDAKRTYQRRLAGWIARQLFKRYGSVQETQRGIQTYKAVCPHLNVGHTRDEQNRICLEWFDGFSLAELDTVEAYLRHAMGDLQVVLYDTRKGCHRRYSDMYQELHEVATKVHHLLSKAQEAYRK